VFENALSLFDKNQYEKGLRKIYLNFLKITDALCPPKPKVLLNAALTSLF
jgi:hypothetical protein